MLSSENCRTNSERLEAILTLARFQIASSYLSSSYREVQMKKTKNERMSRTINV